MEIISDVNIATKNESDGVPTESTVEENGSKFSFKPKAAPRWVLILAAALLLVSGSYDSIIAKLMNKQTNFPSPDAEKERFFEAPFFQTWTMYLGELLCLFVFWIDNYISKHKGRMNTFDFPSSLASFNKPPAPKWIWVIPTVIDFIASIGINYAFVLAQVSTVQLLRNFNVVVTATLTILYLRYALRIHQISGVVVLTAGLILTGIYALLNPDTGTNYQDLQWLGVVLALGGTLMTAFQFVFEEQIFAKYYVSPMEGVGLMGLYGVVIGGILLIICEFTGIEKTSETFYMMSQGNKESTILIISNVTYVISISIFNASGLIVTKLGSGLLRAILIAARTVSIWLIELILKWNTFMVLNFCGLMVVLAGVILYNYNYFGTPGCCPYDKMLKHPVVCCNIRNPDEDKEEIDTEDSKC